MSGGEPDEDAGVPADAGSDDAEAEAEDDGPVEVGDGREKHVTVYLDSAETAEHGNIYLNHSEEEFVVSEESEFPEEATIRYDKSEIRRVDILQHHSSCFITTATGEGATLDALRGFRDGAMLPTRWGRALVAVYERVSPPVARTLERHPDSRATATVAGLVDRCGSIARRREATDSRVADGAYTAALVALYVVGVLVAVVGASLLAVGEAVTAGESG